jgi:hypothetical protein
MAQLRYIGRTDKTLIDIAALTNGKVFEVDDAMAERLLKAFPNEYETVGDASKVEKVSSPPVVEDEPQDNASNSVNEDSADADLTT